MRKVLIAAVAALSLGACAAWREKPLEEKLQDAYAATCALYPVAYEAFKVASDGGISERTRIAVDAAAKSLTSLCASQPDNIPEAIAEIGRQVAIIRQATDAIKAAGK